MIRLLQVANHICAMSVDVFVRWGGFRSRPRSSRCFITGLQILPRLSGVSNRRERVKHEVFCGEAFGSRLPVLEGTRRLHFLIRSCQHSWANKTYTAVTVEIGQTETPRRSSEYCKVPKCDSGQLQPSRSKHQPEQARLMQTGPVDPRVVSNGLVERIHHHNLEPLVDSVL